jgi:hypothetical protein
MQLTRKAKMASVRSARSHFVNKMKNAIHESNKPNFGTINSNTQTKATTAACANVQSNLTILAVTQTKTTWTTNAMVRQSSPANMSVTVTLYVMTPNRLCVEILLPIQVVRSGA